jgi:hypothetical protein
MAIHSKMKTVCFSFIALYALTTGLLLHAADREILTPPLEIKQNQTPYNLQSFRGVPVPNGIAGSDGRLVLYPNNVGASANPASSGQFSSLVSFGALAIPNSTGSLNPTRNYAQNAANIGLPSGGGIVLQRALVGAPFLNRPVSFLFGGIIPLPDENEDGIKLDASVPAELYWRREPHLDADSGDDHVSKGYYFSPHAQTIFAIQAGPISITWRRLTPELETPSDASDGSKWVLDGGNYYRLYEKRYIVSGSAIKTPRTIYWNAAGYKGPAIKIPVSSVQDLQIVYNSAFEEFVEVGTPAGSNSFTSDGDDSVNIVIKKTLWRENDNLYALNSTGRVFMELLGDVKADGQTRQHLGFEIIDVIKHSVPTDIVINLGDRVTPRNKLGDEDNDTLYPSVETSSGNQSVFTFQSGQTPSGHPVYYAIAETFNLNDYQVYWMAEGTEGILWPKVHSRYQFIWPTNPADYSHYARPVVATAQDAEVTAIQLPLENSPILQYQDELDQRRGVLNASYQYYTFLDETQPQHRALIRYNSGDSIYFERVFFLA